MNQTIRGCLYGRAVFAGAVFVISALTGCLPGRQAAPAAPVAAAPADKGTCAALLIRSIWKGEDMGGAPCSHFLGSDGRAPELSGDAVQTVCERTHIRAILTGEAATPFTQRACVDYAQAYPEDRIRRTCRSVSRGSASDMTDVQRSLCTSHVGALATVREPRRSRRAWPFATTSSEGSSAARSRLASSESGADAPAPERSEDPAGRVWQEGSGGTRWWTSASIAARTLSVPAAEPIAERAVEPAAVPEPVVGAAAPDGAAPADGAGPVAAASVVPAPVVAAPAAMAAPDAAAPVAPPPSPPAIAIAPVPATASRVRCEDSYIESIWKGRDSSGPECAAYVAYDGSTPNYNAGRIASVCLGAETRALRSNMPMTAFTLQACLQVLRGRWSPDAPQPAQSAADADWNTDPADTSVRRGLSDAAISSTVDASWRSIERDCASVAPLSSASDPAAKTPVVVTLTVGASGRVRSASARAAGNRELELCIESSVRAWSFPQAIGSTVISVPLSFDARR